MQRLPGCSCPTPDWRGLRVALGYTQELFAQVLYCHRHTIMRAEARPHRCPPPRVRRLLGDILAQSRAQEVLRKAGYPLPDDAA